MKPRLVKLTGISIDAVQTLLHVLQRGNVGEVGYYGASTVCCLAYNGHLTHFETLLKSAFEVSIALRTIGMCDVILQA